MNLDQFRFVPLADASGRGMCVRLPGLSMFILDVSSSSATTMLLDLCRSTAAASSPPGRALIERLAGLLASAGESVPPFGLVAEADKGVAVVVHGGVQISVGRGEAATTLSGGDAGTWLARVVEHQDRIVAGPAGSSAPTTIEPFLDLQRGACRAGGFVMTGESVATPSLPSGAVEDASENVGALLAPVDVTPLPPPIFVAAPVDPPVDVVVDVAPALPPGEVRRVDLFGSAPPELRPPLPSSRHQPSDEVAEPSQDGHAHADELVPGFMCARAHFNDPRAQYCAVCGIAMVQASQILTRGVRPPLGVLVFENGESFPLVRSAVLGRDPSGATAVLDGSADPIVLADDGRSLSRVHAEIRLHGWDVVIVDRGSANGTYVFDRSAGDWARLEPEVPATLAPGMHVSFGQRVAVFESSLNQNLR